MISELLIILIIGCDFLIEIKFFISIYSDRKGPLKILIIFTIAINVINKYVINIIIIKNVCLL